MKNQVSKSLTFSIYDGSAHAVMLGMGETYLITFAIALGFSNFYIGLLAALPILFGGLAQALVVDHLIKVNSRKSFILKLSAFQGFLWLPIFFLSLWLRTPWILVLLLVLYHASSHLVSPLWNSWMGDLVNPAGRGAYFGRRNKYRAIFELFAFLAAGFTLHYAFGKESLWGFGILFVLAFVARMISVFYLHKMQEPKYQPSDSQHYFSLRDFVKKITRNNFGRFVFFAFSLLLATNIASPFFTAYMLRVLNFSYLEPVRKRRKAIKAVG